MTHDDGTRITRKAKRMIWDVAETCRASEGHADQAMGVLLAHLSRMETDRDVYMMIEWIIQASVARMMRQRDEEDRAPRRA